MPESNDCLGTTGLPPVDDSPASRRRVIECPGCRRPLTIRLQYLGKVVTCKYCEVAFRVPELAGPERSDAPPSSGQALASAGWPEGGSVGSGLDAPPMAERLRVLEAALERLSEMALGNEASIRDLSAGADREHHASVMMGQGLEAIRGRLDRSEAQPRPPREAIEATMAARVEEWRKATEAELGHLRRDLEALATRGEALERRRGEDEEVLARVMPLESRLEAVEASASNAVERRERDGAAIAGLTERVSREWETTTSQFVELRERVDRVEREVQGLESRLATSERNVALRKERGDRFDEALGRLQAELAGIERSLVARVEASEGAHGEAQDRLVRLEESREAALGVADPPEWRTGLDAALAEIERMRLDHAGRIDAQREGGRKLEELRGEFDQFRERQAALRRDISGPAEPSRIQPEAKRGGSVRVVAGPPLDLDILARDLLANLPGDGSGEHKRSDGPIRIGVGNGDRPASPGQVPTEGREGTDSAQIRPRYEKMVAEFASLVDVRPRAESVRTVRDLAEYARVHFGAKSPEHALWLRNQANLVAAQGDVDSAISPLLQAVDIYRGTPGVEYGICLFALALLRVRRGEHASAKKLLEEVRDLPVPPGDPDPTLGAKARQLLARLDSLTPSVNPNWTGSIMA